LANIICRLKTIARENILKDLEHRKKLGMGSGSRENYIFTQKKLRPEVVNYHCSLSAAGLLISQKRNGSQRLLQPLIPSYAT